MIAQRPRSVTFGHPVKYMDSRLVRWVASASNTLSVSNVVDYGA
jgi:hypothetical protein